MKFNVRFSSLFSSLCPFFLCAFSLFALTSFVVSDANAQASDPLRPKTGICATRSLSLFDRQVARQATLCQRAQTRLTRLEQLRTAANNRANAILTDLENRYGVQIVRCADSFRSPVNGNFPREACAVIDEPSLARAYDLVERRNDTARAKDVRDAIYNSQILSLGSACVRASRMQQEANWTRQQCSSLQAG